jgi:acetylornithine deacetylase
LTLTEELLNKLIGFPTVSRDSNLELIEFIQHYLQQYGIASQLTKNDEGTKANLYAVFGPSNSGGVMLSGHTDVVPTEGQQWTVDPFSMSQSGSRLYGRGTTDMKGFIASVLAMVPKAVKMKLSQPIHLAFSYDEEIGCVGVRRMIDLLESSPERPAFCIVGEPTSLEVGISHKGKTGAICRCTGVEAHSALATEGLNAIYLATEMIAKIRKIQQELIDLGAKDNDFQVPYSTLHVGTIQGGTALNIIPNHCEFKFEIRNLKEDDPAELLNRLNDAAVEIAATYQSKFPQANIEIVVFNQYPALNTKVEEDIISYVQKLVSRDNTIKLDFGTEGGLFQNRLGIPTVVCGPGSMEQGHKPDEFIEQSQLAECDRMLDNLLTDLSV